MLRVLFICIGNACRSPMAEAIARRDAADVIEAASAGVTPLGFVAQQTGLTLTENGYSSDDLKSKPVAREVWEAADLIINMTGRSWERVFPIPGRIQDWKVDDPYGEDAEVYQRIFEQIRKRVAALAETLREQKQAVAAKDSQRNRD